MIKLALRNSYAVIVVSLFVADTIVEAGVPGERVFGIPNSLDLSGGEWDPTVDGRPIRAEFNVPLDAPAVGIVARLFSWKGHTELVQALPLIKREFPAVRLMIVGADDRLGH